MRPPLRVRLLGRRGVNNYFLGRRGLDESEIAVGVWRVSDPSRGPSLRGVGNGHTPRIVLRHGDPPSSPPSISPSRLPMDAMGRVIAALSPGEAEAWRRRITGWARFNAVEAGAPSNA